MGTQTALALGTMAGALALVDGVGPVEETAMTVALTDRGRARGAERFRMRLLMHRGVQLEVIAEGRGATQDDAERALAVELGAVIRRARFALIAEVA